jgi:hypothetical protein
MSWSRVCRFLPYSVLAFACACGDSPAVEDPADVPLTIFVPGPPGADDPFHFAALEYRLACDSDPESTAPIETATVEARDVVYRDPERPADVWNGVVRAEPGECVLSLFGKHDNGELSCTSSQRVTLSEETPALFADMICHYECPPPLEFPGAATASKTTCLPRGYGVVLTAETPRNVGVESVRYFVTAAEEASTPVYDYLLHQEPLEGLLARWWLGLTDFGSGLVPTSTWKSNLVVVRPTVDIELTALDAQGGSLCQVSTQVDLVGDAIHSVHIAMPCKE